MGKLIERGVYGNQVSRWDMDCVLPSSQLHDVGKIGISETVLNKPGRFTRDEYEYMKTHVWIGVNIIERMEETTGDHNFFYHAKRFVSAHHERWDGTGYPNGLRGLDIPLEGRLMAIVDVYDALISARPYKRPLTPTQAAAIIKEGGGTHFDPKLTDIFCVLSNRFSEIAYALTAETEELPMPRGA